jgi:hypothetical protein
MFDLCCEEGKVVIRAGGGFNFIDNHNPTEIKLVYVMKSTE